MSLLDRLPLWFQTTIALMVVFVSLAIVLLTGASTAPVKLTSKVDPAAVCVASGVAIDAGVFREHIYEASLGAGNSDGAKAPNKPRPVTERSYFPTYEYAKKVSSIGIIARCGGGPRAPPSFVV